MKQFVTTLIFSLLTMLNVSAQDTLSHSKNKSLISAGGIYLIAHNASDSISVTSESQLIDLLDEGIYVTFVDTVDNSDHFRGKCHTHYTSSKHTLQIVNGLTELEFENVFYHEYGHFIESIINRGKKSQGFRECFAEAFSIFMAYSKVPTLNYKSLMNFAMFNSEEYCRIHGYAITKTEVKHVKQLLKYIVSDEDFTSEAYFIFRAEAASYFKTN